MVLKYTKAWKILKKKIDESIEEEKMWKIKKKNPHPPWWECIFYSGKEFQKCSVFWKMCTTYKVNEVHSTLHQYWMLELIEAPSSLGKRGSTTEKEN